MAELTIKEISQGQIRNEKINMLDPRLEVWELNQNRDLTDESTQAGLNALISFIENQIDAGESVPVPDIVKVFRHQGKMYIVEGAMRFYACQKIAAQRNLTSILAETKFLESPYFEATAKLSEAEAKEKTKKAIMGLLALQITSEGVVKTENDKFRIVSQMFQLGASNNEVASEMGVQPPSISRFRQLAKCKDAKLVELFNNKVISLTTTVKAMRLDITGDEIAEFYLHNGADNSRQGVSYPITDQDINLIAEHKKEVAKRKEQIARGEIVEVPVEELELVSQTEDDEEISDEVEDDSELELESTFTEASNDAVVSEAPATSSVGTSSQASLDEAVKSYQAPSTEPKAKAKAKPRTATPLNQVATRVASKEQKIENEKNKKKAIKALTALQDEIPSSVELTRMIEEGSTSATFTFTIEHLITLKKFASLIHTA